MRHASSAPTIDCARDVDNPQTEPAQGLRSVPHRAASGRPRDISHDLSQERVPKNKNGHWKVPSDATAVILSSLTVFACCHLRFFFCGEEINNMRPDDLMKGAIFLAVVLLLLSFACA